MSWTSVPLSETTFFGDIKMAGDIGIREQLVILPKEATRSMGVAGAALALAPAGGRRMPQ